MSFLKRIKDKLYYHLVEKNPMIKSLYQGYVNANKDYHKKHRLRSWVYMILLNIEYGFLKDKHIQIKPPKSAKSDNIKPQTAKSIKSDNTKSPSSSKRKLPYLHGSESMAFNRTEPHFLAKDLLLADIISFDVFDTLLLRPFAAPADLFLLLADKHHCMDFQKIRLQAEREARSHMLGKYGNNEVTIYDIYELVEKYTGIDKEYGVRVEFETELEMCFANPYMKRVFNILKSRNKQIIALSDMYLPGDLMTKLLSQCGYTGFIDIIVSCDYNGNKKSGYLFQLLRNRYGNDTHIIHIGDNQEADINAARKYGVETRYYKNVNEVGREYRAEGMSSLTYSVYAGIINTTLHNGLNKFSPQYEYGFIFGGLYVLGYVNWIHRHAVEHEIDKILFLARDGCIYKKVYEMLFDDIPCEYVYWSRNASIQYTSEFNRSDFLLRTVKQKIGQKLRIDAMLKMFGLEKLAEHLETGHLHEDEFICEENKARLEDFFVENWDKVLEIYKDDMQIARLYFENILRGCRKISLVDVGWRGDNQIGLKLLIQEKWQIDCKVYCLMAATLTDKRNISAIMNRNLECYLFSSTHNRELQSIHNQHLVVNTMLVEIFAQASHPSFFCFSHRDQSLKFSFSEVENYETINDILKGIYSFCEIYSQKFLNYPFLFNISGRDAYMPIRMLFKQYRPAKLAIGHMYYQGLTGYYDKTSELQTAFQIIQNKL